jgi:hypothetical protein
MEQKQHILDDLTDMFNRWQDLLVSLSEEQIYTPLEPSSWTVKDVVAHLWSWQQASVARLQAALLDKEPDYPAWWVQRAPDPEEDVDGTNELLFELSKDKPWQQVYADWKAQFMRFLELTGRISERDFSQAGRFPWMGKYAIADSSNGSLDHHREHYSTLTTWLRVHGELKSGA